LPVASLPLPKGHFAADNPISAGITLFAIQLAENIAEELDACRPNLLGDNTRRAQDRLGKE